VNCAAVNTSQSSLNSCIVVRFFLIIRIVVRWNALACGKRKTADVYRLSSALWRNIEF
jgi:hypothetical protein